MLLLCAGNDNIHLLTSNTRQRLRVDLADFEGNTRYAEYDNFTVLSAPEKFTLASLGTYNGTAGQYRSENVNFPERYWYDSSL